MIEYVNRDLFLSNSNSGFNRLLSMKDNYSLFYVLARNFLSQTFANLC